MLNNKSRVVNRKLCAISVVRPIEAMKPLPPNQSGQSSGRVSLNPKNVILKPKPKPNKNLPGTKLLIKLAQEKEKGKKKEQQEKMNNDMIDNIINGIVQDLS